MRTIFRFHEKQLLALVNGTYIIEATALGRGLVRLGGSIAAALLVVSILAPLPWGAARATYAVNPQFTLSGVSCVEIGGEAGGSIQTDVHFVVTNLPESVSQYGTAAYTLNGVIRNAEFTVRTGGTAHYHDIFLPSSATYIIGPGSVTIDGEVYDLHNPQTVTVSCGTPTPTPTQTPTPSATPTPTPVTDVLCGNGIVSRPAEQCDDGNLTGGDGCSATCQLEDVSCQEVIQRTTGWYGEYFNYAGSHPSMNLPTSQWPDAGHGDPRSSTWNTDWYDAPYFRFSRVDTSLLFGNGFFPFDMAAEELHEGHEFHFGTHWRARVKPASGETATSAAYTLTSDDDAWVYIDGQLVAQNPGIHAATTIAGRLTLDGEHVMDIYYTERHVSHANFSFLFDPVVRLEIVPRTEDCPNPTPTPTHTPTPTPSATPTPTPTPSATPSPTPSPRPSATPTPTPGQCIMEMTKAVTATAAAPGDTLAYALTFKNIGSANCTGGGVQVYDTLDPRLTFVSATSGLGMSQGSYTASTRTVAWNAGVLAPGATKQAGMTVLVNTGGACGTYGIPNTGRITAYEYDNFTRFAYSNTVTTTIVTSCPTPTPTPTPSPTPVPSVTFTFTKVLCPSFANLTGNGSADAYDATASGYRQFTNYSAASPHFPATYAAKPVNPAEIPSVCTRVPGWRFLLASDKPQTQDVFTTQPTSASGTVGLTLASLSSPLRQAALTGQLWVSEVLTATSNGRFGAIRCYTDAQNGDNLEFISLGSSSPAAVHCIAYNVAVAPTPTPSPSPSPSPTPTATPSPTPTATPTPTPSPSPTPTATPTPTPTATPTPTPTATPTPTPSPSPSPTPTPPIVCEGICAPTPTPTPVPSVTPTPTPSATPTPSPTPTATPVPTPTPTPPSVCTTNCGGGPGGPSPTASMAKTVRNLSTGETTGLEITDARAGDLVQFSITVTSRYSTGIINMLLEDPPQSPVWTFVPGSTRVNGQVVADGLEDSTSTIALLNPYASVVITYQVRITSPLPVSAGTITVNTATVRFPQNTLPTITDTASVRVTTGTSVLPTPTPTPQVLGTTTTVKPQVLGVFDIATGSPVALAYPMGFAGFAALGAALAGFSRRGRYAWLRLKRFASFHDMRGIAADVKLLVGIAADGVQTAASFITRRSLLAARDLSVKAVFLMRYLGATIEGDEARAAELLEDERAYFAGRDRFIPRA